MASNPIGPRSRELFERARKLIPGGVNSPVRAFRAVGGEPLFIERGEGPYIWDADGKRYIDYVGSWGPLLFGHAHPRIVEAVCAAAERGTSFGAPTAREVELATRICDLVPSVEMVRLVNSGTEATLSAIRLARAATGRHKIVKFAGCYHGHADSFLIKAGSGVATLGLPDSPGVTPGVAADTLVAEYNDLAGVAALFEVHPNQIAAIILEPVVGNMGVVPSEPGFLQGLRTLCDRHGALLVIDEVMTGFRLAPGGAQQLYGVMPDLSTFGKVIGGGLPIGAYGGRRDIMSLVAPSGPVYQAGTLSGNPVAVAAGITMLEMLAEGTVFDLLEKRSRQIEEGTRAHLKRLGLHLCLQRVGSMWTLFFQPGPVRDWPSAAESDTARFARFFRALLERGVYIAPSQYEACFTSAAHDENVVEETVDAIGGALEEAFASSPTPSPLWATSDFMRACRHEPVARTPVWFMRQAGRYMPEYRAIKERATFLEMCKTPDLAVEVTLQPVRALGVDAAILFSDILITVEAMGVGVEFNPGPHIAKPVRTRADVEALRVPRPEEAVPFVLEAVRRLRAELPAHVPLLGFCGAPWTLANYAVEGGGSKEFTRMKQLCYEDPGTAELLLEKLAATNAAYLLAQIAAGAQAVQIFDTWAGILDPDDYRRWALPYVQKMVRDVHAGAPGAPVIYFARDSGSLLPHLNQSGAEVLSLDWRIPLDKGRAAIGDNFAVQGNLDPVALFAPWEELRRRADVVIERAGSAPGHIFNLGHGILVGTPVDSVRRLVDHVHARTAH